jgi:hypothetical protein
MAFNLLTPGTRAVAIRAQTDVSFAAQPALREALRALLLALPIGLLLPASSRCGELAHT